MTPDENPVVETAAATIVAASTATGVPRVRRLLAFSGINRAVAYGASSRLWQLLSGPVTVLLIVRFMSPETQGLYYTFGSVTALQSFLELGFYLVIINFASHEWARLELDASGRVVGDLGSQSRLISLGRLVFLWYGVLSVLFIAIVIPAGLLFFSSDGRYAVEWRGPWTALVIWTGIVLWALPFISILEGCGQISTVNRFRLTQTVIGNIVLWTTLALGGGLWAAAFVVAVGGLRDLYLLGIRYRRFFKPFFHPAPAGQISWKNEIWPMQWRIALTGATNYIAFSLLTPIIFHYHGAAMAGRLGMTWAITVATQSLAFMWVYPKIPVAARLIARGDYASLDQLWKRVASTSTVVAFGGLATVWLAIYGLDRWHHPLSARLLSPLAAGLFLLGALVGHLIQVLTAYLRAHKQEPIVLMNVTSYLTLGALIWVLGKRFGPTGAGAAYLFVVSAIMLPWVATIVVRSRREWHQGTQDLRPM